MFLNVFSHRYGLQLRVSISRSKTSLSQSLISTESHHQ